MEIKIICVEEAGAHASESDSDNPALAIYRDVFDQFPGFNFAIRMRERVGTDPADLDRWRDTCETWKHSTTTGGRSYNPMNVRAMLNHFAELKDREDEEATIHELPRENDDPKTPTRSAKRKRRRRNGWEEKRGDDYYERQLQQAGSS